MFHEMTLKLYFMKCLERKISQCILPFITANGLNDTKDILINGKIFQEIGVIYISETENWNKIQKRIPLD